MTWDKFRQFSGSGIAAIGLGNIVAAAINGIFWIYLASILTTENYGEIGYFFSISVVAYTIAFLGAGNTLVVYAAKGVRIQPPLYLITIISSLITAIVVFFLFYDLGVSLYVIGAVLFGLAVNDLLGKKSFKNWSKFLIIQRILLVSFALAFNHFLGHEWIIAGFALSFFPFAPKIIKEFYNTKINFSELKLRKSFILNNYSAQLVSIFSSSVDRLLIYPLFGFVLLGNYQLGIQFLLLMNLLPSIVFQYTLTHDASGNPNIRIKKITVVAAIITSILGVILSPIFVPILFPKFTDAVAIIQIMSFAVIPRALNYILTSKYLGSENSKVVIRSSGIFLLVQIVGIISLGNMFGIIGVAISLVFATVCETISLVYSRRFPNVGKEPVK